MRNRHGITRINVSFKRFKSAVLHAVKNKEDYYMFTYQGDPAIRPKGINEIKVYKIIGEMMPVEQLFYDGLVSKWEQNEKSLPHNMNTMRKKRAGTLKPERQVRPRNRNNGKAARRYNSSQRLLAKKMSIASKRHRD